MSSGAYGMESTSTHKKYAPTRKLKQVKVDNWGTFFLQRLLQLYFNEELLDFSIKFESNDNVLKVHKLVITTCTDYFLELEHAQTKTNSSLKNMIIMPSDMPYECVKSIISFMYTGQLEYWTSEQNALYYTAQKMKMSVLTKLLDAQSNINVTKPTINDLISEKNISVTSKQESHVKNESLSDCKPIIDGKKFALPKRKLTEDIDFTSSNNGLELYNIHDGRRDLLQNSYEGPSRFDLPEIEDLTLGVFSSFDDITYHTKPIVQAPEKVVIDYQDNVSSMINNEDNMMVRINSNVNCVENRKNDADSSSDDEWTHLQSNLKKEKLQTSPLKKLRFDFDEKENCQKSENNQIISSNSESTDSVDNHAKIIREVLKNYPHLVQHNKNIRLKIMQKESKNNECSSGKTKVSYVVLKSDSLMVNNDGQSTNVKSLSDSCTENNESGPWQCNKCNLNEQYTAYFMYRSHMQDVHGEKFDPRICEHCGYKATKRNILMYHMYTKHNVPPPKSMSFPKCHLCSYVALSESLLTRHLNNHKHEDTKLISTLANQRTICYQCDKQFADTTALLHHETVSGHEITDKRIDAEQMFLCLHCGKRMANAFSLQVHIECYHKNAFQFSVSQATSIISSDQLSESGEVSQPTNEKIISISENCSSQRITKSNSKILDIKNTSISIVDENEKTLKVALNNDKFQSQTAPAKLEKEAKPMKFSTYDVDQHSQLNDEIVEVVEELETVAIEKCGEVDEEDESCCKKLKCHKNPNAYKNIKDESSYNQKDCLFNSENANYTNANEMGEIITYVEEETEIVEYETFNNL